MANKNLDTEVNLVSFISLLSVCICFLLLTAIWIQIGSLNVKQAVGGQPNTEKQETKPSFWIKMNDGGELVISLQDFSRSSIKSLGGKELTISAEGAELNFTMLLERIQEIRNLEPELEMALILPTKTSVYQDIISIVDKVKETGLVNVGVSPI